MDRDGAAVAVGRDDRTQLPAHLVGGDGALRVARRQVSHLGQDPDLEEVDGIVVRRVKLAVRHTASGGHALHVSRPDDGAAPEAVPMLERPPQHPGDDLHVAVRVRPEAASGRDAVLVDDPQRPEAHVLRVVIVGERERVAAVEPIEARLPALAGVPDGDHRRRR